jgi:hypothetical protein
LVKYFVTPFLLRGLRGFFILFVDKYFFLLFTISLNPVDFWGVSLYNKRVGERKKPSRRPGGEDVKQPFRLSVKEANPAFAAHW